VPSAPLQQTICTIITHTGTDDEADQTPPKFNSLVCPPPHSPSPFPSPSSSLRLVSYIAERAREPLGRKLLLLLDQKDGRGQTALDIAAHKGVDAENVVSFLLRLGARLSGLHKSNIGPRSTPRLTAFYDAILVTHTRRVRQMVYARHDSSLAFCQVYIYAVPYYWPM
jgi:hypothetical protein